MSAVTHSRVPASAQPRWLLVISLALNLFFIGIVGAMGVRYLLDTQSAQRNDISKIERIAATLPAADGDLLRAEYARQRDAVEAARDAIHRQQDEIRAALRKEPFDAGAMRAAQAGSRAARESFYQVLHGVVLTAASRMSTVGRSKLADWRSNTR
jgi:uncharacterized membrane protein